MPCRTPILEMLFSLLLKYSRQLRAGGRLAFLDYGDYANTNMHCCPQEDREEAMDGRLHCIIKRRTSFFS